MQQASSLAAVLVTRSMRPRPAVVRVGSTAQRWKYGVLRILVQPIAKYHKLVKPSNIKVEYPAGNVLTARRGNRDGRLQAFPLPVPRRGTPEAGDRSTGPSDAVGYSPATAISAYGNEGSGVVPISCECAGAYPVHPD